jgi:3-oxoacyl-[acyl-carrier-protein] synthase II
MSFDVSKRIVITGLGVVSPLGNSVSTCFSNIIKSKSGVGKITHFDAELAGCDTKIAAEIKFAKTEEQKLDSNNFFNPLDVVEFKEQKKMDKFIMYALKASDEAIKQANWHPKDEESLKRTGVVIGAGIGGLELMQDQSIEMETKGIKRISPFFIPKTLINLASGWVSIKHGFMGPNHSVVTACATGGHAIYDAAMLIKNDMADVVVCGGAESSVCRLGIGGFNAAKALSTAFNDDPEKASRPWDAARDGFVMGEGAGILVLESYEHAKKRGANILAEYVSAGMSGDAYHITAPAEDGRGARFAMEMALRLGKVNPESINYVNAHGTSTPLGDQIELNAVKTVLKPSVDKKIIMSSTKSSTGHLLGAAGSLEAVLSICAIKDGIIPPTLNLDNPCEGTECFNLVPHKAIESKVKYALSNSFGFGGTNISLIFKAFEG